MSFTLVTTADGTVSCHDSETGEWMHNRAGAYAEALQNYAEPSLALELVNATGKLAMLDACYGLGYNTWVLFDFLAQHAKRPFSLSVTAIEKSSEILTFIPQVLEHPSFDALKNKISVSEHNIDYRTQWCDIHTKGGNISTIQLVDGSCLEFKIWVDDLRHRIPKIQDDFDLIFHDAFSAQKMPELWTVDLFKEYARLLKAKQGRLFTYSAAAGIRGGLEEAGFEVGKTVALGKKQGGTMAGFFLGEVPSYVPLNEQERAYIQSRSGIPYRDAGLNQSREIVLETRFQEQDASNRPSGNDLRKILLNPH